MLPLLLVIYSLYKEDTGAVVHEIPAVEIENGSKG
jgi:hypothetical protein